MNLFFLYVFYVFSIEKQTIDGNDYTIENKYKSPASLAIPVDCML